MSRSYSMFIRITGADPERIEAVQEAVNEEWPFDDDCRCTGGA